MTSHKTGKCYARVSRISVTLSSPTAAIRAILRRAYSVRRYRAGPPEYDRHPPPVQATRGSQTGRARPEIIFNGAIRGEFLIQPLIQKKRRQLHGSLSATELTRIAF